MILCVNVGIFTFFCHGIRWEEIRNRKPSKNLQCRYFKSSKTSSKLEWQLFRRDKTLGKKNKDDLRHNFENE